jgi:hypothetical protein
MSTDIERVQPTGMEILAQLARTNSDPAFAMEIGRQIVQLQSSMNELEQSKEKFAWERAEREAKRAFSEAITQFKENVPVILKTKRVSFESKREGASKTEYWHAELDKICDILIPALVKLGITHRWKSAALSNGQTQVTCYLKHRLGYEEEGASMAAPPEQSGNKNPVQAVASTVTLLERYTLLASCGITVKGMDNDGQGALEEQEAMDEAAFKQLASNMEMMATKGDLREAYLKAMDACGVSLADLDRSDWLQRAKYKKEAKDFVEIKNKVLGELQRRK